MEECINFEISFAGKVCIFIPLYRSPNQSHNIFETFVDNLELNLDTIANENLYLIVILGDFNAKSSNWYKHGRTTHEGSKIEAITSQFGPKQLIQEPTHILYHIKLEPTQIISNSSSCIDLVSMSQANLVMESGVRSSLHENCHHQLVYATFNLHVWYLPPYKRETWHYQHANIYQIKRAIEQFPWEKSFRNLCINEMVHLFNKTIKNIISNYITHETIICDDRDQPWINSKIKQLIQEIHNTYRIYILRKKNPQIFEKVNYLQNQ